MLLAAAFGVAASAIAEDDRSCLACDREMRKTLESIQAWRRLHGGRYPGRLADLKNAALLPANGAVCPGVLQERAGATADYQEISSRTENGDPPGTYEYEMSDRVLRAEWEKAFLPPGSAAYTRQELKTVLLQRPFFEQVPILRCAAHRTAAPPEMAHGELPRRNATATGLIYWSRIYWESQWVDDVPFCARSANVLFGLEGPPFHSNRTPSLPSALDLSKWSCAFGNQAWWWPYPIFEEGANRQEAPHLGGFAGEEHGRPVEAGGTKWWIDGLVQVQGRVLESDQDQFRGSRLQAFAWQKTGLPVGRKFSHAEWLQGTVWTAQPGEVTAWLAWHYADGQTRNAPIIYGQDTARFWGDLKQVGGEEGFPKPIWNKHEFALPNGIERWVRLYRQEWNNPRPEIEVVSVDFISHRQCPAGPFIAAINTSP